MPHYYSLGKIPPKRHTQFRDENGNLYYEQLFSTEGFSSNYCNLYHIHPPTQIIRVEDPINVAPQECTDDILKHRSFQGFKVKPEAEYLAARKVLLFNNDCQLSLGAPQGGMGEDIFYRNSDSDELIFIHEGTGTMFTQYGKLPFRPGDYIHIPRGVVYQIEFDTKDNRILVVEAHSPIAPPKRYLSRYGQLLEHSPFCERDIRKPEYMEPINRKGEFLVKSKKKGLMYFMWYANHPFDVVGWDGCEYPYIFSIHDFEPITGRLHMPPPIHQTFEAHNMVVCSFVPRMYDYHPLAIPAPYYHSNIDSDELLYYVEGEFMSRKHVERGMITLHPAGVPHGPHPGAIEKSIGQKETKELAVMVDTFFPLKMTQEAKDIEDENYVMSWAE